MSEIIATSVSCLSAGDLFDKDEDELEGQHLLVENEKEKTNAQRKLQAFFFFFIVVVVVVFLLLFFFFFSLSFWFSLSGYGCILIKIANEGVFVYSPIEYSIATPI
jgi:hypothetical protein